MRHAAALAIDLGRSDLRLDVDETDHAAQTFYERPGFTATGARDPRERMGTSWVEHAIRAGLLAPG